ncbi:hypothetical protein CBR_g26331 [Chara braunii]|uniref:2-(3-amino-3-carboxypropyl)histidine synthase n=1 Tax=Chara braunii TaxID=69332 RepID=A0A388L7K0_CHABU|nr:hypothetical protein CBR_g26331 [Chara braunii]|eukprot:GBG78301.1 hypothetical protein CBR_g26331 [Chara braunii]
MSAFTLEDNYDIEGTVEYILRRRFTRVCLQFPDDLLKDSSKVVAALKAGCGGKLEAKRTGESGESRQGQIGEKAEQAKEWEERERGGRGGGEVDGKEEVSRKNLRLGEEEGNGKDDKDMEEESRGRRRRRRSEVQFFVMADTTFGHCCVDEVAASHVDAECVIHYGYACVSRTSRIPVRYVFGKRPIDVKDVSEKLLRIALGELNKPLLVLYAPEYGYAIEHMLAKDIAMSSAGLMEQGHSPENGNLIVARMVGNEMEPEAASERCSSEGIIRHDREQTPVEEQGIAEEQAIARASSLDRRDSELGGLTWSLPEGRNITDYVLAWIGPEGPALTNWMLTYNSCKFVRYDPDTRELIENVQECSRVLKRRYYLVERAKDASIVGIVVGTLGAAGYLTAIKRLREVIAAAGKKSYVFVMGKPNPAKLANFPECEVFVLVACPQTALLDSKEYYAPVITPFEAELAFVSVVSRLSTTPAIDITVCPLRTRPHCRITGSSLCSTGPASQTSGWQQPSVSMQLATRMENSLSISAAANMDLTRVDASKVEINSAAEFLSVRRTYKGLDVQARSAAGGSEDQVDDVRSSPAVKVIKGRSGRAASYNGESGRRSNTEC